MRRVVTPLLVAIFALLLTLLTLLQLGKQFVESNIVTLSRLDSDFAILLNRPDSPFMMVYDINYQLPSTAKVLAFRYGEIALYGKRHFMVAVDPALKPVYLAKTQAAAWKALRHLGVTDVFVPSFMANPVLQNSILGLMLANPSYAHLQQQLGEQRLFSLTTAPESTQLGPNLLRFSRYSLGKNDDLLGWQVNQHGRYNQLVTGWHVLTGHRLALTNQSWLFRLAKEKCIFTGQGTLAFLPTRRFLNSKLNINTIYQLSGQVAGKGLLTVSLMNYSQSELLGMQTIWSAALLGGQHKIASQFVISPYAKHERLVVCLRGSGHIVLSPLAVRQVATSLPSKLQKKRQLIKQGYQIYQYQGSSLLQSLARRISKAVFYHAGFFASRRPVGLPLWQLVSGGFTFSQPNHNRYFILLPAKKIQQQASIDYQLALQGHGFAEVNLVGGNDLVWNNWISHFATYRLSSTKRQLNITINSNWLYQSALLTNALRVALPFSSNTPAITTKAALILRLFPLRKQLLSSVTVTNLTQ